MKLKGEVLDKMAALITAAFGLIAALAWNGAIRAIFAEVFGDPDTIPAMLAYAIIVTMLAVIVTIWVARAVAKAKGET
jgi:membrane protein YdbS with pleckstrin-like domain